MSLFTEVAYRFPRVRTGTDRYGAPTYGHPGPGVPVAAWWEPRQSSEDTTAAAEQYSDGYWLYLPLDVTTDPTDEWELAGERLHQVGRAGRQPGGVIVEGYLKFAVERVTG